jgi:Raf kinase inhibitor-like YbhB/YbcL family protein
MRNKEKRFMRITSPAFEDGGTIPDQYSKEGGNQRPPLRFDDVPADAKSLALVVDDPDAPQGMFTHWLVYNIPPATRDFGVDSLLTIQQAINDYGHADYDGPRPPSGEHRYVFKVYALDDRLTMPRGASRLDMEEAVLGHVIGAAELTGHFAARVLVGAT